MLFVRPGIAFLSCVTATAQVFIVDAANGAGAHFTDLPAAIAAVPDGASLLVRSGSYTPFTLQNKGLRIVGEAAVRLNRAIGVITIGPTSASQVVVLRNVELPLATIRVTDAAGPVVLEQCRGRFPVFFAVTDLEVTRSANVQVHECTLEDPFPPQGGSPNANPAIQATDSVLQISRSRIVGMRGAVLTGRSSDGCPALGLLRSRCVVVESTIIGGTGGPGCRSCALPGCSSDGGHGAPAVTADSATLISLGSSITGGPGGGPGCCQPACTCGGNGGPALRLANATAAVLGAQPLGGAAGGGALHCNSLPGVPIESTGQTRLIQDPAAQPPSANVTGTQARGQNVAFTVYAPNGSLALLALSYRGDLFPLEALGIWGSLLAPAALTVGPVPVTTGNSVALPLTLPPSLPLGEVYFGQFVTLTNQQLFASNAFPLLVTN